MANEKILIVDDEKMNRALLKHIFDEQYEVLEAANGEEALDIIDKNHVDLIVSDVMMPNVGGYELTKQLREANYMLPILMVTAKETLDDKREGFLAGVDDYMVKPIDMDEMVLRVGVLLRRANIVNQRKLIIQDVVLSYDEYTLRKKNEIYQLPQKEFQLLYKLLSTSPCGSLSLSFPQLITAASGLTKLKINGGNVSVDIDCNDITVDILLPAGGEEYA